MISIMSLSISVVGSMTFRMFTFIVVKLRISTRGILKLSIMILSITEN
jgi:hypothetical protein